ncbi:hydroxymethylcytosylglucuronate/cytosylglucuronate synthase [Streptomyces qinglanensis]|uniref:hydroxymethylcytosylglucuronate/cytosylglucurona te synthase n=1 Tax=Streptomyces qinglanensis TaxID=943816 RepID=UPI003D71364A
MSTSPTSERAPVRGSGAAPRGPARTVALVGAEFGWGSGGKLSAVLAALAERAPGALHLVGLGSGLGRPLLTGHPVDAWYDLPASPARRDEALREIVREHAVVAALVVLDGEWARALEAAGVPTVFVDSLPFLWTDGDRPDLPLDVSVYCAQRCPELPPECHGVLGDVRELRWIEGVVAPPEHRLPRHSRHSRHSRPQKAGPGPYRSALVNLGGLRAPRLADWSCYPRLVVPPVLAALAGHGVREVHLAGNLPPETAARLTAPTSPAGPAGPAGSGVPQVTVGPLTHGAFLDRLAECDILLTSPGLTTLLEAGARGVPTVCLPPQNLSQIFNARFHHRAVGAGVRVRWPEGVCPEDEALALRTGGEGKALEMIYRAIAETAGAPEAHRTRDTLRQSVGTALRAAAAHRAWDGLATALGTGGAGQVADALLSLAGTAH